MFDGELSFALKLAREMGRPDWRAMLAGMSSTEYADWHRFYSTHYFHDVLLDMHFSGLTYTVLSLFFSDPDMHPLDFSLLNRREADEEPEDDVLNILMTFAGDPISTMQPLIDLLKTLDGDVEKLDQRIAVRKSALGVVGENLGTDNQYSSESETIESDLSIVASLR